MPEATPSKKNPMPKGGRKGGASFPRYTLKDALPWSKKLVSKTHHTSQPEDVIFSGVVGAKGGIGQVKIAALKQYLLLEGTPTAYIASELAKKIGACPAEELEPFYQQAALNPPI